MGPPQFLVDQVQNNRFLVRAEYWLGRLTFGFDRGQD